LARFVYDGLSGVGRRPASAGRSASCGRASILDSLNHAQSAVQRHLSVGLWSWSSCRILKLPALPMFVIAGVVFLCFGRRIGSRAEESFIGTRPRAAVGRAVGCRRPQRS